LALKFEELIRSGTVSNYGDGAQVVRVSRSRVTQMTGLLNLAPDIQEEILFLATAEARQLRISEPSGDAALESTTRAIEESAPFRSLVNQAAGRAPTSTSPVARRGINSNPLSQFLVKLVLCK
jgi:hypothetical protein